ncbi:glycosyltransferase [Methylobacillus sp. Pita1]|uniref:glycosyltransferase n=1 Tax=Methylobacillus sp. Pita1 TaxID=3382642 RepID=UPI0038B5816B
MADLSPIALFVYNRPKHTRETVEALLKNAEAENSDLLIFSDAAKHEGAHAAVNEVREYIRQIAGFKTVTIVEREKNWGLANSVIDGVTRLCNEHGSVIVLEDDLRVSPHFLAYMNAGLQRYQNNENVMQIAGYMFPAKLELEDDAFFLPFISSWGWATWSRAWDKFDPSASNFSLLKNDKKKIKEFNLGGKYDYFRMLKSQQDGKTNSWAIRWYLSVFYLKGLTLYPKKNLVENLGFDGTGENCIVSGIETSELDINFRVQNLPSSVAITSYLNDVLDVLPKPRPKIELIFSYLRRILTN